MTSSPVDTANNAGTSRPIFVQKNHDTDVRDERVGPTGTKDDSASINHGRHLPVQETTSEKSSVSVDHYWSSTIGPHKKVNPCGDRRRCYTHGPACPPRNLHPPASQTSHGAAPPTSPLTCPIAIDRMFTELESRRGSAVFDHTRCGVVIPDRGLMDQRLG
jgi:hypothetical protein